MPAPTIPAWRSTMASSASMASPKPGKTLHDVETAIDAVLADVSEHGVTADELDLAKNRLIAEAVYAQDNQATLARWYGAALATGETVEMVRDWPDRHSRRDRRRGARGGTELAQPPLLGDRLSRQQPAGARRSTRETNADFVHAGLYAPYLARALRSCCSARRFLPPRSSGW